MTIEMLTIQNIELKIIIKISQFSNSRIDCTCACIALSNWNKMQK